MLKLQYMVIALEQRRIQSSWSWLAAEAEENDQVFQTPPVNTVLLLRAGITLVARLVLSSTYIYHSVTFDASRQIKSMETLESTTLASLFQNPLLFTNV